MSKYSEFLIGMLGVLAMLSLNGCGGEDVDTPLPQLPDRPELPADKDEEVKEDEAAELHTVILKADGNSRQTYQLIRNAGFNYEVPDNSRDHSVEPFQHIRQAYDAELQQYVFLFHIHALTDDDRGLPNITDRQRNELKTDSHSPKDLVGQEGDSMVFQWEFRMPEGMVTTTRFCHLHQLKGLDNVQGTADVSMPLITITVCTAGPKATQYLQVRRDERGDGTKTVAQTELLPLLGQWLTVEETVTFGAKGSYALTVRRASDGMAVLTVPATSCDMWRTGSAGIRPKWGIYRYIGDNRSMEGQLRDEVVAFADFSITKKIVSQR